MLDAEKEEYEIQSFGFPVEQMKLERRHIIKQYLSSFLKRLSNSMIKNSNVSKETSSKMVDMEKELSEKMFAACEKTLQSIEKLDDETFCIPNNVLLHQDLAHIQGYTKEDEEKLKTENERLKNEFLENSVMISAIESENSKYNEVQILIKEDLKVFGTVQETFTAINIENTRRMVKSVLQTLEKSQS